MRRAVSLFLFGLLVHCAPTEDPNADVCTKARSSVASCGVVMPLLSDGPCTGVTRALARCISGHAKTCDELASLSGRLDACVADELDAGGDLLPPTDLPPPPRDSGVDARIDAAPSAPKDAGAPDAVADASGPWLGLDATGTLGIDEEARYQTPELPAGTYTFTLSGTGDADLYVKKGAPPALGQYNCRPFRSDSSEMCTMNLTAPTVMYVLVRGSAATSTFALKVRP